MSNDHVVDMWVGRGIDSNFQLWEWSVAKCKEDELMFGANVENHGIDRASYHNEVLAMVYFANDKDCKEVPRAMIAGGIQEQWM